MRGPVWLLMLFLASGAGGPVGAAESSVTFTGKVTDAAGKPAGGATVIANFWGPPRTTRDWHRPPLRHSTTAGADGSFRLAVPVTNGDWEASLLALKEGHGPGGQAVRIPGGTTGLTLSLTRPGFVAGKVVDRAGRPVAGATVRVQWLWRPDFEEALQFAGAGPAATTDARGRFRLGPLPAAARSVLSADDLRYAAVPGTQEPVLSGTEDVMISLPPPGTVLGRVVFPDGQVAARVTVHCQGFGTPDADAVTDAGGEFRISRLRAGSYLFRAALPGASPDLVSDLQGVALPEGAVVRCPDLHLVPGGIVTGKVTDEKGQPMAGIGILSQLELPISGLWVPGQGPGARTAADGTYRLRLPPAGGAPAATPGPPGGWHVTTDVYPEGAFGDEEDRHPKPGVVVSEGETTRLDLTVPRPVLLRVRVLDARGRPAAGATAQVTKGGLLETEKAGETGRFAVGGLVPAQPAKLLVFSRDRRQGDRREVIPAQVKGELVIRLQELSTVSGLVRDKEGAPVAGAAVWAERILRSGFGWGVESTNRTSTDARGHFSLPLFPDAQYHMSAGAPGFSSTQPRAVEVGAAGRNSTGVAPLDFVLERAEGAIAGVVLDGDGKPAAGANVEVERTDPVHGRYSVGRTMTDAAGRFRVAHLPPGEVEVGASGLRSRSDRRPLKVGASDLRLVLIPWEAPEATPPPPQAGALAPEIQVGQWVNGTGVKSWTDLRGKWVVLQFSSVYNPAAPAANEALEALFAALQVAGRQDVVILALYDSSAADVAAYARAEKLPFPIGIVSGTPGRGADSPAFRAYGVRQLPTVFVIDPEGIVRAVNPSPEELKRLLKVNTGGAAGAEEVALRYTLDPTGPPVSTLGQRMQISEAPPALKLPRLVSRKPIFLTARLGEGADPTYTFVLDETASGAGYDRLYVDSHHLRDLTGEAPLHLTSWRDKKGFKPARLLIEVGGQRVLYDAAVVIDDRQSPPEYRLQPWGYYSGEGHLGEKSYPVSLVDYNGNGLYNDRFRGYAEEEAGDVLLMDVNGDGQFDQWEFASPEFRPCARWMGIDGRWYELTVRADGAGFRVIPAGIKLAALQSAYARFILILASPEGLLTVRGQNGQAQVPVGEYRLYGWQIEERDESGSVWVARGEYGRRGEAMPRLSVQADTPLPRLGSPLVAGLEVSPVSGREFRYSLEFAAASGEAIDFVGHGDLRQRMPEPRLQIVDAHGKEIANLPFEYG